MAEGLAAALRLVFVTPGDRTSAATLALARAALRGGATAVLLREPQLPAGSRETLARRVAAAAGESGALLAVSRDIPLARRIGAAAVHTGHAGPDVAAIRASGLLAGRSAHWPLLADDLAADYLTLSPFGPTPRSLPRPLLTQRQVATVLATAGVGPVVALGGLRADDVAQLPGGLTGVAVLRAIADAPDPEAAARALRAAVEARFPPRSALA